VREGVFMYFFSLVGLPREQAFSIALMYLGLLMINALIGGGIELKEIWNRRVRQEE